MDRGDKERWFILSRNDEFYILVEARLENAVRSFFKLPRRRFQGCNIS